MLRHGLATRAAGTCGFAAVLASAAAAASEIPLADPERYRITPAAYGRGGPALRERGHVRPCVELPRTPPGDRPDGECDLYFELSGSGIFGREGDAHRGGTGQWPAGILGVTGGEDDAWAQEAWGAFRPASAAWGGARFWMGQRAYKRRDIEGSDLDYWEGTGTGLGVEGIRLDHGRLALAYFASSAPDTRTIGDAEYDRLDVRIESMPVNRNGSLDVGLDLRADRRTGETGTMLTARHRQYGVLGGSNEAAVQLGTGVGSSLAVTPANQIGAEAVAVRLLNQISTHLGGRLALDVAGFVEHRPNGVDRAAVGTRPIWTLTKLVELELKLSVHQVRTSAGSTRMLRQVTGAVAIREGDDIASRPEARAFVTLADWDRPARARRSPQRAERIDDTAIGFELEHLW